VTIGETLGDPADPRPLPVIQVDEPSLSVTLGINTSPLAGRSGNKLTARLLKNRLDAELIGNVSLRVNQLASARTRGRSRAAASCSSACSSRPCAARATRSRSASRRS
jgi:predicted membrane GTPase involved in stress response